MYPCSRHIPMYSCCSYYVLTDRFLQRLCSPRFGGPVVQLHVQYTLSIACNFFCFSHVIIIFLDRVKDKDPNWKRTWSKTRKVDCKVQYIYRINPTQTWQNYFGHSSRRNSEGKCSQIPTGTNGQSMRDVRVSSCVFWGGAFPLPLRPIFALG